MSVHAKDAGGMTLGRAAYGAEALKRAGAYQQLFVPSALSNSTNTASRFTPSRMARAHGRSAISRKMSSVNVSLTCPGTTDGLAWRAM